MSSAFAQLIKATTMKSEAPESLAQGQFTDGDIYYQTYSGQYERIYIDINKYIEDIVQKIK